MPLSRGTPVQIQREGFSKGVFFFFFFSFGEWYGDGGGSQGSPQYVK